MNQVHPRKQFFLIKSSQPRLLAGIEIIFAILLLASGLVFASIANRNLTDTYFKAHLTIRNMQEILVPSLVIINFAGLIASLGLAIFFTHRIAGPVYRLNKILKQIGQGNLAQTVHFRKGDELRDLDQAAGEMIQALQIRIAAVRSVSKEIIHHINTLEGGASAFQIDSLRNKVRELDEQLAAFHLPPEME